MEQDQPSQDAARRGSVAAPNYPFAELPAALVDEVLQRTQAVGQTLLSSLNSLRQERTERRKQLSHSNLLTSESNYDSVQIPTTCGIDGAYAVERLLATDFIAAAAVAVEGLTPPSETRWWPDPKHQVFIQSEAHDADTATILRAAMIGMELVLASNAPHDVVFLDGSLTTPTIFFNQALSQVKDSPNLGISNFLLDHIKIYLEAYRTILKSQRTDRCWIAVPKYTTRREFGDALGWPEGHDDRAMLTHTLMPGELTKPQKLEQPSRPWHISTSAVRQQDRQEIQSLEEEIVSLLSEIRVAYYRPRPWLPALRLEVGRPVAETPGRMAAVIQAVKHQCATPAMLEPYPLYMADRMVKSLASALPTFRQVTSQHIAETFDGNPAEVYIGLYGYRSEAGR